MFLLSSLFWLKKGAGGVTLVEYLPNMHKALDSIPCTTKRKRKKKAHRKFISYFLSGCYNVMFHKSSRLFKEMRKNFQDSNAFVVFRLSAVSLVENTLREMAYSAQGRVYRGGPETHAAWHEVVRRNFPE